MCVCVCILAMTNKKVADVEAKLDKFQTDVEAWFQDLEEKFSYVLADLKANTVKQQAESNRRHEGL